MKSKTERLSTIAYLLDEYMADEQTEEPFAFGRINPIDKSKESIQEENDEIGTENYKLQFELDILKRDLAKYKRSELPLRNKIQEQRYEIQRGKELRAVLIRKNDKLREDIAKLEAGARDCTTCEYFDEDYSDSCSRRDKCKVFYHGWEAK